MREKIKDWSSKNLSYGGRPILVQSVLSTLPLYHAQAVMIPDSVISRMYKIMNKYLWGGNDLSNGMKWSSFQTLGRPYGEGGLNIRLLDDMLKTFSQKLWFQFRKQDSLWAKFLMEKYCRVNVSLLVEPKATDSRVWKRLLQIREETEENIHWVLRDNVGAIPLWKLSNDGTFSSRMTWDSIRAKSNAGYLDTRVWNNVTPKKCSFLTWRALRGWIPTDENLRKRGMIITSKCQHCSAYETDQHVFMYCDVAWETWSYFASLFRVNVNKNMTVGQVLSSWFSSSTGKVHIRIVLPVLVIWALWEYRNKVNFQVDGFKNNRVIQRITDLVSSMGNCHMFRYKHWKGDIKVVESFQVMLNAKDGVPKYLIWQKPHSERLKMNTDGAARTSTNQAAGGMVMRDDKGELNWAKCKYYGIHSALYAETRALLEGLQACCEKKIAFFDVEIDSTRLEEMVRTNKAPWHLQDMVHRIRSLAKVCRVELNHVYREQNAVADFLANLAIDEAKDMNFDSHNGPQYLKSLVALEGNDIGYIRSFP